MWQVALWSIAKWIFAYLPVETIVARCFSIALERISTKADFEKLNVTIQHITESTALMAGIMADAKVTGDEVTLLMGNLSKLKATLLATWARKESGKLIEAQIASLAR